MWRNVELSCKRFGVEKDGKSRVEIKFRVKEDNRGRVKMDRIRFSCGGKG